MRPLGLLRHKGSWIQGEGEFGEYRREYATAVANGHTSPTGNNPNIRHGEMEKQEQVERAETGKLLRGERETKDACNYVGEFQKGRKESQPRAKGDTPHKPIFCSGERDETL